MTRPRAVLDHIAVMAAELDEGIAWFHDLMGVTVPRGGRHDAMATHNAVCQLDGGSGAPDIYLEIIAPDPSGPTADRPRWFGFDAPGVMDDLRANGPRFGHWLVRTPDIDASLAGLDPAIHGEAIDMARGDLRWRIAVTPDGAALPDRGLIPTFLEWPEGPHPAQRMPDVGLTLETLEIQHPDADALASRLTAMAVDLTNAPVSVVERETHGLHAVFRRSQDTP